MSPNTGAKQLDVVDIKAAEHPRQGGACALLVAGNYYLIYVNYVEMPIGC